jgi:hypothetical protein
MKGERVDVRARTRTRASDEGRQANGSVGGFKISRREEVRVRTGTSNVGIVR